MNSNPNPSFPRAGSRLFLQACCMTAVLCGTLAAQQVDGRPYGQPSECQPGGPAALGLYLTQLDGGLPVLRLEGGTPGAPAMVLFSSQSGETSVPGGGTLFVGPNPTVAGGCFDERGVFLQPLLDARFDGTDTLYAQGVQPMTPSFGAEFSAGLRLRLLVAECAPVDPTPQPPEEILVEEFAGLLGGGHLEAALDLALNSKGDALTLDLAGNLEVPVYPGITVGGKVAIKARIQRGEDSQGNVVYDVLVGADAAASAGVGAGVAGAGVSGGQGVEVVWRYASTHEVARALRSAAILQAVGPRLEIACLALDTQLENIDRAIEFVRRLADRGRGIVRARMPWRNNPVARELQRRIDDLREQRREIADRARHTVGRLISWVADERIFLIEHALGYEVHSTMAIEASISTPVVTGPNFGASIGGGYEVQYGMRVERVPESEAMLVEHKQTWTRTAKAMAGCHVGASLDAKRVIELATRVQVGANGLQLGASGTTVKVSADARLLGAVGTFVAVQAGVGGQVVLELRLEDLLAYRADAFAILTGDDDQKFVELLRAFPIRFEVRGRYEAGIAAGIGLDIDGVFKGGISATAMMVDQGAGFVYEGGSGGSTDNGETMLHLLVEALREGPVQRAKEILEPRLQAVKNEVVRVARR